MSILEIPHRGRNPWFPPRDRGISPLLILEIGLGMILLMLGALCIAAVVTVASSASWLLGAGFVLVLIGGAILFLFFAQGLHGRRE